MSTTCSQPATSEPATSDASTAAGAGAAAATSAAAAGANSAAGAALPGPGAAGGDEFAAVQLAACDELTELIGRAQACLATGVARSSWYRHNRVSPAPPRDLSDGRLWRRNGGAAVS